MENDFFSRPAAPRRVRERSVEDAFRRYCKSRGWECIKCTPMGTTSYPDRLVLFGDGKVAWLELKAPGKRPTPLQYQMIQKLLALGYLAGWADTTRSAILWAELAHAILTSPDVDPARISKDHHQFCSQSHNVQRAPAGRGRRAARPRHG